MTWPSDQVAEAWLARARHGRDWVFSAAPAIQDLEREALGVALRAWLSRRKGFVYLARQDGFERLLKIGRCQDVPARMRSLTHAGTAAPWYAVDSWAVPDAAYLEAAAQRACRPWRIKGELFSGSAEVLLAEMTQVVAKEQQVWGLAQEFM